MHLGECISVWNTPEQAFQDAPGGTWQLMTTIYILKR